MNPDKRKNGAPWGAGAALLVWMLFAASDATARPFAIAYYPSLGFVRARVDLREALPVADDARVEIRIVDDRDNEVARVTLRGGAVRTGTLKVGDLGAGTYRALCEAVSGTGEVRRFEAHFERERFPWERNDLGVDHEVRPPFQPVRVTGDAVDVVLRRMTMNGFGLWSSVRSAGRELLARPMTITFRTQRGSGTWREVRSGFVRASTERAVFEAENDGGFARVRTRSTIDYDGCMRVELDLRPGNSPQTLEALSVEIPLRDDEAPLWHLVRSGDNRFNPAGLAPAGKGVVWRSSDSDNGEMLGSFFPYLWIGGEERGIAFFADNDHGWVGGDRDAPLELSRENGVLTLRLRLIRRSVVIDRPIHVVFGLQASPAKPMPADWRTRQDVPYIMASGAHWGTVSTFADKYPAGRDFSIADAFVETRRSGKIDRAFIDRWILEKYKGADRALASRREADLERSFGFLAARREKPQLVYFDGSTQNLRSPEWAVFQDEWKPLPFQSRQSAAPIDDLAAADEYRFLLPRTRSYQDFGLWYAREWMRRGFGIYVDRAHPANCYDTLVCNAYVRGDGRIQPSAEIWNLREYFRRLWTLEQQIATTSPFRLMLTAHMTNALLVPVEAFVDVTLDNEWRELIGVGEIPQSADLVRTEMMGRQVGAYPHALNALVGDAPWREAQRGNDRVAASRLTRTEWGMRMVHEIIRYPSVFSTIRRRDWPRPDRDLEALVRVFGYGSADVTVVNYWSEPLADGAPSIAVSATDAKWIGLWRPSAREVLLVLVNWSARTTTTNIRIFSPTEAQIEGFIDAEAGTRIDPRAVELAAGAVRVLRAKIGMPPQR